ncbi:DUF2474 domain-containing protein [Phyllobacterium endophyticum]|nr:DUF2474 domain-containing protein [Phyllobacterium endophyticum]TXR47020.1 DUF2474 family protein [Phyllobacterium endophyticum]
MPPHTVPAKPWLRRLCWFSVIWTASVAALAIAAAVFRVFMNLAGLTA